MPKKTSLPTEKSGDAGVTRELRDERLCLALLAGPDIRTAAKTAQMAESTVYERLKNPEFQQALKIMRRAREAHALAKLSDLAVSAVLTLGEVLDPDIAAQQGAGHRVNAAKAILDFIARERQQDETPTEGGAITVITALAQALTAPRKTE